MYTRTYPERMSDVPEGYKGTAMSEGEMTDTGYIGAGANPWETREAEEPSEKTAKSVSGIPGFLGGLFQNGKFSLQSIGVEELLIIAAAAYMLLSREGDKTCGIMLLVLLFIS
jgi:hypothetical protein